MSDIFILIINIVAILAGIAAIKVAGKQTAVLLAGAGIIIFAVIFAGNFFYFGPKNAGDKFLNEMRDLDFAGMRDSSCVGTELHDELSRVELFRIFSPMVDSLIHNEFFIPIINHYNFTWAIPQGFSSQQVEERPGTLYIRSNGLTDFCVYNADGLGSGS